MVRPDHYQELELLAFAAEQINQAIDRGDDLATIRNLARSQVDRVRGLLGEPAPDGEARQKLTEEIAGIIDPLAFTLIPQGHQVHLIEDVVADRKRAMRKAARILDVVYRINPVVSDAPDEPLGSTPIIA
jgi:hypothetical protein